MGCTLAWPTFGRDGHPSRSARTERPCPLQPSWPATDPEAHPGSCPLGPRRGPCRSDAEEGRQRPLWCLPKVVDRIAHSTAHRRGCRRRRRASRTSWPISTSSWATRPRSPSEALPGARFSGQWLRLGRPQAGGRQRARDRLYCAVYCPVGFSLARRLCTLRRRHIQHTQALVGTYRWDVRI